MMRLLRIRFTVRGMMVVVALVGLNLAASVASRSYVRVPKPLLLSYGRGGGPAGYEVTSSDGSIILYQVDIEKVKTLEDAPHVVIRPPIPPPPPSFHRNWTPIYASAAMTFLVLLVGLLRALGMRWM